MLTILANNVNDALQTAASHWDGPMLEIKDSRNGPVASYRVPVTTAYNLPRERVLFHPGRDANPFFHLFEALWMLGGRNDVEFLAKFNRTIHEYSDDGFSFHGAYGYRWRNHFNVDQIHRVAQELRLSMNTRRAVISMWDPYIDPDVAAVGGKDVPCNIEAVFSFKQGRLDLTVFNRSNDLVWGAYGANAVHMSMLLEYMSIATVIPLGRYFQVSNDLHIYEKHWKLMADIQKAQQTNETISNPYSLARVTVSPPLFESGQVNQFDADVARFLQNPYRFIARTQFMAEVVAPMAQAYELYKGGEPKLAIDRLGTSNVDWLQAGKEWVWRRMK